MLNKLIYYTEITLDIMQHISHSLILYLQKGVIITILLPLHIWLLVENTDIGKSTLFGRYDYILKLLEGLS